MEIMLSVHNFTVHMLIASVYPEGSAQLTQFFKSSKAKSMFDWDW